MATIPGMITLNPKQPKFGPMTIKAPTRLALGHQQLSFRTGAHKDRRRVLRSKAKADLRRGDW